MPQVTDRSLGMDTADLEDDISSQESQVAWLAYCAPVILQPEHDIRLGHPLVKMFYKFCHDSKNGEALCELILVYEVIPFSLFSRSSVFEISVERLFSTLAARDELIFAFCQSS